MIRTEQIVYKQYVNLGVAVDTPRGLVVPVMRAVDRMTIGQIAAALGAGCQGSRRELHRRGPPRRHVHDQQSRPVGGTYSTPIINHPEVACLLLGRSRWMPVAARRPRGTEVHDAPESFLRPPHHRQRAAARFLNQVIDYLETPAKLLITA